MSAVPALKLALRDLLRDLYPDAVITYGPPQNLADTVASVLGAQVEHDRPTVGGPRRAVEETANLTVVLSCAAAGDGESWDDAQQEATEAAYEMLDVLVEHFRDRDHQTLGGVCRDAIVSSHELAEYKTPDPDGYARGRIGEITATITCRTRI